MMSQTLPTLAAFPPSPVQAPARTLPASTVTMPGHPSICLGTRHILSWRRKLCCSYCLLIPCAQCGAQGDLAPYHNLESSREPLPLLHQGCTGPA